MKTVAKEKILKMNVLQTVAFSGFLTVNYTTGSHMFFMLQAAKPDQTGEILDVMMFAK